MNLTERVARIDRNGLSERVYTSLKEAIMDGKFPPGERLSPEELAKHFEVSITPVRDALKRLEGDALVEVVPRQGVFVSQFSRAAIKELFDIRHLIEQGCIEGVSELSDAKLQEIVSIMEEMESLSDGAIFHDYAHFIELDSRFHAFLVAMRGNSRLIELYEELQWPIQVVRGLSHSNYHRADQTIMEHRAIVAALLRRDVAEAQAKVAIHLNNAREDLLRHVPDNTRDEHRS
jgi:GntR family transcriptional regulator, rspAB operon transcriptional repressor